MSNDVSKGGPAGCRFDPSPVACRTKRRTGRAMEGILRVQAS